MSLLAFSTVAETLIAVKTDKGSDFKVMTDRRGQAEFLVPSIQELLAEHTLKLADVDRIGVVTGPGSFTGLRVGLAAAEGFGIALEKELVGIDAFTWWRTAARMSGLTKPQVIALDTLRDDVFIAAFDGQRTLLDPQVMDARAANQLVDDNNVVLLGNAVQQLADFNFVPLGHGVLADALLHLTATLANTNTAPVYLRAPDVTMPNTAKA